MRGRKDGRRRDPDIRVGISGYNYPRWRGDFYPTTLRLKDWLRFASRAFNSIELNGTFYSLKSPDVFRRWYEETPDDFIFAIKGSRFITHNLKLRRAEGALANFYASGLLALEEKTGPFLWQLPATYRFDSQRIDEFLRLLPKSSRDGARLARHHDDRLRRGALTRARGSLAYRHALEVRHESYFTPELYDLLRAHGCAFVIADTAEKFPYAEELTADFVYVRLHGSRQLYASGYTDDELDRWAERIREWTSDSVRRDAYIYFDNDALGHAPHDARRLAERLGCAPPIEATSELVGAER
ncbi:MAG TPA: DUF72 domain-containing protein [Gemmatimonadaceae bacterium]|nr:DUF72 domain-containing protein [Gemmatimonadaceae bacterium]